MKSAGSGSRCKPLFAITIEEKMHQIVCKPLHLGLVLISFREHARKRSFSFLGVTSICRGLYISDKLL